MTNSTIDLDTLARLTIALAPDTFAAINLPDNDTTPADFCDALADIRSDSATLADIFDLNLDYTFDSLDNTDPMTAAILSIDYAITLATLPAPDADNIRHLDSPAHLALRDAFSAALLRAFTARFPA